MKKLRFAVGIILALVAINVSACSIHEDYRAGPAWDHPWTWHYRY
jgi:hypothetical protein